MEGARQITEAHIRMQLEASAGIPIEGSPAAGLHDDPGAVPSLALEPTPEAMLATMEEQQMQRGGGGRGEGGTTEVQREQQRIVGGAGKGKGSRPEGRAGAGYVPRTPQRTSAERAEGSSRHEPMSNTPLFSEEQLKRFQDIYQRAPLIYPEEKEAARRRELRDAEERSYMLAAAEEGRRWLEERARLEEISRAAEESRRREEELRQLRERAATLEKENAALKMREGVEWGRSSQFATPEETAEQTEGGKPTRISAETEAVNACAKRENPEKEEIPDGNAGLGSQPDGMQGILSGMMKLMQGMQAMQTQILDVKRQKDLEVVKSGIVELPKLQEWKADTAPLDLTDWFLSIEPAMGDLSDGSQQWWDGMLCAAKSWYSTHLEKTPLERVVHRPEAPPELREVRYQRLEKRVAALLMAAIPVSQQEEVIAGKEINTISILGKLMLSYQPGGLTEKAAILHALDSPEEAQGLTQAVMGLRRWLRWHRRAGDVGVVRRTQRSR